MLEPLGLLGKPPAKLGRKYPRLSTLIFELRELGSGLYARKVARSINHSAVFRIGLLGDGMRIVSSRVGAFGADGVIADRSSVMASVHSLARLSRSG
jgi:hypothetical protein